MPKKNVIGNWTFGCSNCTCEFGFGKLIVKHHKEYMELVCPECSCTEINIFRNTMNEEWVDD